MQAQKHPGSSFLLRGVVLGLLALFTIAAPLRATQSAAPAKQRGKTTKISCLVSATLNAPIAILSPDELGIVVEDPDEIVRADCQQRATAAADYAPRKLGFSSQTDHSRFATISPPLLV